MVMVAIPALVLLLYVTSYPVLGIVSPFNVTVGTGVNALPLTEIWDVALELTLKEFPHKRLVEPLRHVISERPGTCVEQINPIEIMQPEQGIALPQSSIPLGKFFQLKRMAIVAWNGIEASSIRQAEFSFAIDKHLAVGQFNDLPHFRSRQSIRHHPMAVCGPQRHCRHPPKECTQCFSSHKFLLSQLHAKLLFFYAISNSAGTKIVYHKVSQLSIFLI